MLRKVGELKVDTCIDYLGKIVETLEDSGYAVILNYKTYGTGQYDIAMYEKDGELYTLKEKKPNDKETMVYYTAKCTSCGRLSPIGNYCIWCGEKDTCLEGGETE